MRYVIHLFFFSILTLTSLFGQVANHVVISEVYGGGGNSGSTWKNDFVELYNPTNMALNLTGWSVQYGSVNGTTWQKTPLTGVIQPKSYFLIQEAQGTGGTQNLPTPDVVGIIAMSATAGKIALVSDTLTIAGSSSASVIDFIGYGNTPGYMVNMFAGLGAAPTLSNITSAERKASVNSTAETLAPGHSEEKAGNGYYTNDNANDFVAQSAINPQNSASSQEPPPSILSGIGAVEFRPSITKADSSVTLTLVVRGSAQGSVTGVRFPKHILFEWSHAIVTATSSGGASLSPRVTQDSVSVFGFSIAANDSIQIRVSGLSAPDTTVIAVFRVETAAGSDYSALVNPLPSFILYGTPRPIAAVKVNDVQGVSLNLQKPVTVRGIVTVSVQFGGPGYVQDVSGGLAVYDQPFESAVNIGDEVTITGIMTQYNGLAELTNVTLHKIHSSGNEVQPAVVTPRQIATDGANGLELYEGVLVQLNRVTVRNAQGVPIGTWAVSGAGSNFWLHDGTDSVQIRIDADVTSIANQVAPTGEFDIVGVVGQFISSAPYIGGYQFMPRSAADVFSRGPIIAVSPVESGITANSFVLAWETVLPGSSFVRYGRSRAYELGIVGSTASQTTHSVKFTGLLPATPYHIQAFSVSGSDTSLAVDRVVSTASQGSTGQINVYFNKWIDSSVARNDIARGNADLTSLLLRRINAATKSIDCALYSLFGSVGQSVAGALVQAKARGVKVRFIIEKDNMYASTGLVVNQIIVPAGIPWILDDFDAVNAGLGLHHNKFFIFDYRGGSPDQTWVWTGSWNPTDPGTNDDVQNSIEIQDQALAGAYTIEFNEMWGSESDTANAAVSRFGARKLDNTPHVFNINGVPVELYFSPSDRTTSHIISTLDKAQNSINIAMLTLTRTDIASELRSKKSSGVKVRAILDNRTDTGSQFDFLASSGVDIRLKPASVTGLFHHKYSVIDAELSSVPQYVITGSHNWSTAAESSNNENTLIIQSNSIANQYLQEFAARYKAAGGSDNIVVSVERTGDQVPRSFSLAQNYPNPFNPVTSIRFTIPEAQYVRLIVYDVLGRVVSTLVDAEVGPGEYKVRWDASMVSSGVYYYALHAGQLAAVRSMVLVK